MHMMLRYVQILILVGGVVYPQTYDDTVRLKEKVLSALRYRADVKPLQNQSESVKVIVTHTLKAISEVNVIDGYAEVESELEMKWRDEYLIWNATEFNGIENLSLPKHDVWTPAVKITGTAEDSCMKVYEEKYIPVWVTYEGTVSLFQTVTSKAKCKVEVSYFPYDSHTCFIKIESIMYGIEDVELKIEHAVIELEETEINIKWELNSVSILLSKSDYKRARSFDSIIVEMDVKRRNTFSVYQRFFPMTALMLLNMLTPFVPPDSGERVTLCITIVLAFTVATDSVAEEIPKDTNEVSVADIVLFIYTSLNVLTVSWSVLIVSLFARGDKVPTWLIKMMRVKAKYYNVNLKTDNIKCNNNTGDDSIDSIKDDGNVCHITWQDVTKKMDKVYFLFFLGLFVSVWIISTLVLAANNAIET